MKLKRFVERPRQNMDDNLIPLINVVFLMLIFFMIAGRIAPSDSFKITPPKSNSEQDSARAVIQVLVSADGRLAVDGEPVTLEALATTVTTKLSDAVSSAQAVAAATQADQKDGDRDATPNTAVPIVTLKADGAIKSHRLSGVLDALRAAGSRKVTLLTARSG